MSVFCLSAQQLVTVQTPSQSNHHLVFPCLHLSLIVTSVQDPYIFPSVCLAYFSVCPLICPFVGVTWERGSDREEIASPLLPSSPANKVVAFSEWTPLSSSHGGDVIFPNCLSQAANGPSSPVQIAVFSRGPPFFFDELRFFCALSLSPAGSCTRRRRPAGSRLPSGMENHCRGSPKKNT